MRYRCEDMICFAVSVGVALGMNDKDADTFGRSLVYADMRGQGSHGLMRLPTYVKRVKTGLIQADAAPKVVRDGGALLAVDGQNGMGVCTAQAVMELCTKRAAKTGACIAAVCNSNHFGYAAYFTKYAAHHHMIGFAMGNAYRSMAPYGGAVPMLGTNPLAVAIPAKGREPYSLDMATSVVAQGKIILAEKEGHDIPLGWGLDKNGHPTTDPSSVLRGGSLTPFGGAKGYGIALMIETLCVCLAKGAKSTEMGSMYDFSRTQNTGFLLGAIDISCVMAPELFEDSAARLFDEFKATPTDGVARGVLIPGELEDRKFQAAEEHGIELPEAVECELRELAVTMDVIFPSAYDDK